MVPENLYWRKNHTRECRLCSRQRAVAQRGAKMLLRLTRGVRVSLKLEATGKTVKWFAVPVLWGKGGAKPLKARTLLPGQMPPYGVRWWVSGAFEGAAFCVPLGEVFTPGAKPVKLILPELLVEL